VMMPTWDDFMVPVLRLLADGHVRTLRQVRDQLIDELLTSGQRAQTLPSDASQADSRMGWAASDLQLNGVR